MSGPARRTASRSASRRSDCNSIAGRIAMQESGPERAQQLYVQGVVLQSQGRLIEAIAAWRNALSSDQDHTDARYNLAVALAASGDSGGAESSYIELLNQHPDHAQA